MRYRERILLGFGAIIAIFSALLILDLASLYISSAKVRAIAEREFAAERAVEDSARIVLRVEGNVWDALILDSSRRVAIGSALEAEANAFKRNIVRLVGLVPEQKASFADLGLAFRSYLVFASSYLEPGKPFVIEATPDTVVKFRANRDELLSLIQRSSGLVEREFEASLHDLDQSVNYDLLASLLGAALAVAVAAVTALLLSSRLTRPIEALASVARLVESGDLGVRATIGNRSGEPAILASVFNSMLDAIERSHAGLEADIRLRTEELTRSSELQEKLRRSLSELAIRDRKYRTLAESLPQMIFVKDRESAYLSCNARFAAALGIEPDEIAGKDDYAFYPREYADKYRENDREVMRSGTSAEIVEKWPAPGGVTWINTVKTPIWDDNGDVAGVIGIFWDVSERMRLEEERERSLREKEILLREVNHRVKNNLQLISAMIRLESDESSNAEVQKFVRDTISRIRSIAITHDMMYVTDDVSEIDVAEYIREISGNLVDMYSTPGCPVSINVNTGDLRLDLNRMVPLGLATNEMITNSLKYAFTEAASGTISIEMSIDRSSGHYVYRFIDDGIGLPASFDVEDAKSLGMIFINNLAKQLEGTLSVKNGRGLEYELRFPTATR